MATEVGGAANHEQAPWNGPLPESIEDPHQSRSGKRG